MQRDSLILALFILAAVIYLGVVLIPKFTNSVSDTARKIKTANIEQVAAL